MEALTIDCDSIRSAGDNNLLHKGKVVNLVSHKIVGKQLHSTLGNQQTSKVSNNTRILLELAYFAFSALF